MSYSIENLKKLRASTEVGIRECIKALEASDNDLSRAMQWLKERSLSSSKSSNFEVGQKSNKFGLIRINIARNKIIAFSLKCESDFVAMNSVFIKLADDVTLFLLDNFTKLSTSSQKTINENLKNLISEASYSLNEKIYAEKVSFFLKEEEEVFGQYTHHNGKMGAFIVTDKGSEKTAKELAMQAVANSPIFISREDIESNLVSAKLEEIKQLIINENSEYEELVMERIVNGRLNKWISEICFLEQNDFREPGKKIKQIVDEAGVKIRYLFLINIEN